MTINRLLLAVALRLVIAQAGNDTAAPTVAPTVASGNGSNSSGGGAVTPAPTAAPTVAPTAAPTVAPTAAPTAAPTCNANDSNSTCVTPTSAPTVAPTAAPTAAPTMAPTCDANETNSSCTPAPTAAPTVSPTVAPTKAPTVNASAPTAAPTAAVLSVTKVVVEVTVANVDFSALSANTVLMTSFKTACADSFAASAGVPASSVVITVTAASVKVKADITPPSGTTAAGLSSTLAAKTDVASSMVTKLNTISDLSTVTSGSITVSTPSYTTQTFTVIDPKVVVLQLTVQGVDHSQLIADATMFASFKTACATSIAASAGAGVAASAVAITVTDGRSSVNVNADITPPAGMAASALKASMQAKTDIASNLVTALASVVDLDTITAGTLTVAGLVFTTMIREAGGANNTNTTATDAANTGSASGAADLEPAMGVMSLLMAAVLALVL